MEFKDHSFYWEPPQNNKVFLRKDEQENIRSDFRMTGDVMSDYFMTYYVIITNENVSKGFLKTVW